MSNSKRKTVTKPDLNAVNDNSKLHVIVYGEDAKRNYVMVRYFTNIDPTPDGTNGQVDFGKKGGGLWAGYATLDHDSGKWIFHRVRQVVTSDVEEVKDTKAG
jgi:hypothetical protein